MRTAELCTSQIGVILDDAGKPCAGGLLWFLDEAASTPRNIWSRDGEALRNPLPLGSDGCLTVQPYLETGNYSLRLYKPTSAGAIYDPDDFPNGDWALVRTWIAAGAVPQTQLNGLSVEGIDGLKALSVEDFAEGTVVIVDGYYQRGDCEARVFVLRSGAATPDEATIVEALGGGAYWEWTPGGDLDARAFGAVPDGIRDVSASLSALAAYAAANSKRVVLPAGTYRVGGTGSVSFRHLVVQDGVKFLNDASGSLYSIGVTASIDCTLSEGLRHASSAGKVLLDFSSYTGSEPVRTLWNEGWGEVGVNDYDLVTWAPASAALRVSGNICLGQNVGKLEIEADCDITRQPGDDPSIPLEIGEVSSVGGQALIQFGVYQIGKAYSSAVLFGRSFSGDANVLVDANWAMGSAYASANYSGTILHGVPGGGLVSVTTSASPGSPTITIGGVVSEQPIFGAVTIYAGGGIVCADSSKPVKARHFSTIDDDAVQVVAVANGGVVDLDGREASVAKKHIGTTIENGSVSVPENTAFVGTPDGGAMTFRNCRISFGTGCSFGRAAPVYTPVYPVLEGCQVSGGFTAEKITATDSTFDTALVLAGDMGDTLLLRNTYTGAGSALDLSGVTSWAASCRIAENQPVAFNKSPSTPYWPQTEGELRAGGTGAQVDCTDASKGGDTAPLVAAASLRTGFASCTATACYALGTTNGIRAKTYDGNAAGADAVWFFRFNFTKLS